MALPNWVRARGMSIFQMSIMGATALGAAVLRVLARQLREVGLAGEIRPAPRGQERLKEAAKLGFTTAIVPKANAPKKAIPGLSIHAVERVDEAMDTLRGLE